MNLTSATWCLSSIDPIWLHWREPAYLEDWPGLPGGRFCSRSLPLFAPTNLMRLFNNAHGL